MVCAHTTQNKAHMDSHKHPCDHFCTRTEHTATSSVQYRNLQTITSTVCLIIVITAKGCECVQIKEREQTNLLPSDPHANVVPGHPVFTQAAVTLHPWASAHCKLSTKSNPTIKKTLTPNTSTACEHHTNEKQVASVHDCDDRRRRACDVPSALHHPPSPRIN